MDAVGTRNVTQLLTWRKKPLGVGGHDDRGTQASQRKNGGQLGKPIHPGSDRKVEEPTGLTQQILSGPGGVQGPGPF